MKIIHTATRNKSVFCFIYIIQYARILNTIYARTAQVFMPIEAEDGYIHVRFLLWYSWLVGVVCKRCSIRLYFDLAATHCSEPLNTAVVVGVVVIIVYFIYK